MRKSTGVIVAIAMVFGSVLVAVSPGFAQAKKPAPAAKPARVTEAEVRRHAMEALFRQEPSLQKAVEELDLELME